MPTASPSWPGPADRRHPHQLAQGVRVRGTRGAARRRARGRPSPRRPRAPASAGIAGAVVRSLFRRLPQAVVGCSSYVLTAAQMRPVAVACRLHRHPARRRRRPGQPSAPALRWSGWWPGSLPWKGQHLFLEAAAQVAAQSTRRAVPARRRADVRRGSAIWRSCGAAASTARWPGRVEFAGLVPDPRPEYDRLTHRRGRVGGPGAVRQCDHRGDGPGAPSGGAGRGRTCRDPHRRRRRRSGPPA